MIMSHLRFIEGIILILERDKNIFSDHSLSLKKISFVPDETKKQQHLFQPIYFFEIRIVDTYFCVCAVHQQNNLIPVVRWGGSGCSVCVGANLDLGWKKKMVNLFCLHKQWQLILLIRGFLRPLECKKCNGILKWY